MSAHDTKDGKIPIGLPVDNMTAMVVDESGQALPRGFSGELWLSGLSLASGYWGNEEETNARFVSHGQSKRFYRTGDLVRRTANGTLLYEGRADDQIKVNGIRVELGEIEAALLSHPAIDHASVNVFTKSQEPPKQEKNSSLQQLRIAFQLSWHHVQ